MQVFIITGTSGAGKSVVIRTLEDAGFNCIDNLPVSLLESLIAGLDPQTNPQVAVAIDGRQGSSIEGLPQLITQLKKSYQITVLFLDASNATLIHRFSETRRRHPLSPRTSQKFETSLIESINKERQLLSNLSNIGHHIDTTNLSSNALRNWIRDFVKEDQIGLTLLFESFGYKYGIPQDVDIVFDVRCIPNPHYEADLKALTGNDHQVLDFLYQQPDFEKLQLDIIDFLTLWVPKYQQDGRSYLTIGIGCTGGQHRSVAMVNEIYKVFENTTEQGFQKITLLKRHRELDRFDKKNLQD
jgi:RNase adapter protein RapZ